MPAMATLVGAKDQRLDPEKITAPLPLTYRW
jgi:hypothetical protein